jgi:predicted DNA-binding protein
MGYDTNLAIRITKEMREELEKLAEQRGVKVSDVARDILSQYLAGKRTERLVDSFLNIVMSDNEIRELIVKKLREKD